MRFTKKYLISAVATLATGVLVVGATVGAAAGADTAMSLKPADLLPDFAATQSAQDRLPLADLHFAESLGFVSDSSRLLGSSTSGSFWAALNNKGDICLVVTLKATSEGEVSKEAPLGGASCTTLQDFSNLGTSIALSGISYDPTVAYLLPPDAHVSDAVTGFGGRADGNVAVYGESSQLVIVNTKTARAVGLVEVSRDGKKPLALYAPTS